MRYIGFKNFRRFEELKPLQLAPITIFVGGNNSGKSTVVKGLLSVLGFLNDECLFEYFEDSVNFDESRGARVGVQLSHNQRFSFNKNYYAHIGTCNRALRSGANPKEITFQLGMGPYGFEIVVSVDDDSEESTSGRVVKFNLIHNRWKYEIRFDLVQWTAEFVFHPDNPNNYLRLPDNPAMMKEEGGEDISLYARHIKYFKSFDKDVSFLVRLPEFNRDYSRSLIDSLVRLADSAITAMINTSTDDDFDEKTRQFILNSPIWSTYQERGECRIPRSFARLENVEYVYAHAVTQSVIYSAKDTNDYLVKTVHDFANCRITHSSKGKKSQYYRFIKKWMEVFEIGDDYSVRSIGGEAHIVKIKNTNGDWVNMADMGMGSIQLMILLFRMAAILNQPRASSGTTIILEEPEQNLHPKLQSKLADLLMDILQEFRVSFIVETHSEYLIRESQVIVGNCFNTPELFRNNPFRVYYFPSKGQPYDMEYTPSGKFAKPFGEGFFDEAANLHMMVLKNARK